MKVQALFPGLIQDLKLENPEPDQEARLPEVRADSESASDNAKADDFQGALIRLAQWRRKKKKQKSATYQTQFEKGSSAYVRVRDFETLFASKGAAVDLKI